MVMSVKYNVILVAILTAIQVMVQDTVVYSIRMVGGGGFYVLKMLDNNGYPSAYVNLNGHVFACVFPL